MLSHPDEPPCLTRPSRCRSISNLSFISSRPTRVSTCTNLPRRSRGHPHQTAWPTAHHLKPTNDLYNEAFSLIRSHKRRLACQAHRHGSRCLFQQSKLIRLKRLRRPVAWVAHHPICTLQSMKKFEILLPQQNGPPRAATTGLSTNWAPRPPKTHHITPRDGAPSARIWGAGLTFRVTTAVTWLFFLPQIPDPPFSHLGPPFPMGSPRQKTVSAGLRRARMVSPRQLSKFPESALRSDLGRGDSRRLGKLNHRGHHQIMTMPLEPVNGARFIITGS